MIDSLPLPSKPPPRTFEELDEPSTALDKVKPVATARVVLADYELLQHDFSQLRMRSVCRRYPELRRLGVVERRSRTRHIIDGWLLRNAAIISRRQAASSEVNTPIKTVRRVLRAYRPPLYGRALVAPVGLARDIPPREESKRWLEQPPGLLDLKGTGVADWVAPRQDVHGTGLLHLESALEDLIRERILARLFRHAGTHFTIVPTYAILDLGFDIIDEDGSTDPASIQVRRAHLRPPGGVDLPANGTVEQKVRFEIEMLLRQYGVTSANPLTKLTRSRNTRKLTFTYGHGPASQYSQDELRLLVDAMGIEPGERFEGVNVQLARGVGAHPSRAELVDFGHYGVKKRFKYAVLSLVSDRILCWGGAIRPDSPFFVQPNPTVAIPQRHWRFSKHTSSWARQFRSGAIDRQVVERGIDRLVATAIRSWV